MILATLLFIITYILLLSFPNKKHFIALTSAIIYIVLNIIPIEKAFLAIDFNVILMLLGTMGTVSLFIESKMPLLIADFIIDKVPNVKWMTICLAIFSGLISAFIDNVATVLMIVPITIIIAKKLQISPIPTVIAVSIFSNLEGAATLVGDTTAILFAAETNMNFLDFFFNDGKIGLFFIVQGGLIVSTLVLLYLQRKNTHHIESATKTQVNDFIPSILLLLTVVTLIAVSFIPNTPKLINGTICITYFIIGLLIKFNRLKSTNAIKHTLLEIDYKTLILLTSLFIIIGGIKEAGLINEISKLFLKLGNGSPILIYTIIIFASVIISAFIDNIPYVATMLPIITTLAPNFNCNPLLLYYGLLIGATLGGNISPIGASANITSIGLLNKNGYEFNQKTFYKYSIPLTLAAILTGYIITLLIFI